MNSVWNNNDVELQPSLLLNIISSRKIRPKTQRMVQLEVMFHLIASKMWTAIFKMAFEECEACKFPSSIFRHTCLYLWNETYLIEQGWSQKFCESYFDVAYQSLQWTEVCTEYRNITTLFDAEIKTKLSEKYWRTRCQMKLLKSRVIPHIIQVSINSDLSYLTELLNSL